MDAQRAEYFAQMIYLAGRIALLDQKASEHWARLEKPLNTPPSVAQGSVSPPIMAAMLAERRKKSVPAPKQLYGGELKRLRTAAGVSVSELAALVGVKSSVITYWERQDMRLPSRLSDPIRKCLAERTAA